MTDGPSAPTRRGFLALAGGVALAGCGGLDSLSNDEPTRIDAEALKRAVSGETPSVPERFPVAVEASAVDDRAAAARESLSSVPAPLGAEEVPNGAIRAELTEMREEATEALDAVSAADSPAAALSSTRRAREAAAAAATAWRAVDGTVDSDDVRARIPAVRSDLDAFRTRWRYVGDGPIRAVLAHAEVEDRVAYAGRRLARGGERARAVSETPISVGESAGDVAAARASLTDGAYLFDRFDASLADARPVGAGLRRAGEALTETVNDRRGELPAVAADPSSYVDPDVEGTAVGYALADLRDDIDYADGIDVERATGQRANVVLSAFWTLTRVRAFQRLRERVDGGDYVAVESAEDVRTMRESAVRAVERALAAGDHPGLDHRILRVADRFGYVADRMTRHTDDDGVAVDWIARDAGQYVVIESMARATPATSAEVAGAIRSHLG